MKKTIKKCPRVLAIVIVSLISFVPFYYTLTMSTHSTDEIMLGVSAIPGKYLLTNISTALNDTFWVAFKNSLIVSLLSMTGSVLISLMAGYGLVVYQFRLKRVIYNFVLLTMMVPSVLGIIGYMQEMRVLRNLNSADSDLASQRFRCVLDYPVSAEFFADGTGGECAHRRL